MRLLLDISVMSVFLYADILLPDNFKSGFTQTITNSKGKVIKYEGEINFKQEREIFINEFNQTREISSKLFKWSYYTPTKKEVCSDGVQILIIDHDLEQVSKYLIDDGLDLEEILKVAQKLSSNDYKALYKDIEYLITVDNENRLKKIFYVDSLDNRVKIVFINMNYNSKSFNDKSLECPINPDYDVIEG
jgi:outer membrane lipoprotein carrier protein